MQAIEALVLGYWPLAKRTAYLIVQDSAAADDIAQEAVLAALEALERFDPGRPLGPWVHRIALNRAINHVRSAPRRREVSTAEPLASATSTSDGLSEPILAALRDLDPIDRSIVVGRHLLGFEPQELAVELKMNPATVRTRLHRALELLRTQLEEVADAH